MSILEENKYLKKYQHINFVGMDKDNNDITGISYNDISCPNLDLDCVMMEHDMDIEEQKKFYKYVVPDAWKEEIETSPYFEFTKCKFIDNDGKEWDGYMSDKDEYPSVYFDEYQLDQYLDYVKETLDQRYDFAKFKDMTDREIDIELMDEQQIERHWELSNLYELQDWDIDLTYMCKEKTYDGSVVSYKFANDE